MLAVTVSLASGPKNCGDEWRNCVSAGSETETEWGNGRIPYHSSTADKGSRVVDGRWTIHNSDCRNRSFVASWSESGKRKQKSDLFDERLMMGARTEKKKKEQRAV